MQFLIVANWKLNPVTLKEAKELFLKIKKGIKNTSLVEVVICPPFIFLPILKGMKLKLGAQDVFWEERGAFTGEISPLMLKELGVEYVIVGHSERRKYFNETDLIINKKIKKSLEFGLKVIFCIGETLEQRKRGETMSVLKEQLKRGLENLKIDTEKLIIAYEPVWAIGTGNNCSLEDTKEAVQFIKNYFKEKMRVLYGGSVNSKNSGDYLKKTGADGLLVGSASLNPQEFLDIIKSTSF